MKDSLRSLQQISFLIAVVCSIASQFPFLLGTGVANMLKAAWFLPLVISLLYNPKTFVSKESLGFYSFGFIFLLYCYFLEGLTGKEYIGTDVNNIFISIFVFVVSYSVWSNCSSERFMNLIVLSLSLSSCLLGYFIYRDFLSASSLEDVIYAYSSKNSSAQILLNTVLVALCYNAKEGNKYLKYIIIFLCLLLLIEIFQLKSRSTMVGVLFVIIYFAVFEKNKTYRKYTWILLSISIIYLIYNSGLFDKLLNNIILANRDATDLNSVSSGRLGLIEDAMNKFSTSEWTGVGNFYIDCFPVSVLAQYGVIGASIIFVFLIYLSYKLFKIYAHRNRLYTVTLLLFLTIMLNSLFEAQPPFGPGMKCFTIWMMIGFSMASRDTNKFVNSSNL